MATEYRKPMSVFEKVSADPAPALFFLRLVLSKPIPPSHFPAREGTTPLPASGRGWERGSKAY